MEKLGDKLAVVGMLFLIYTIIGMFSGTSNINLFMLKIKPVSGFILANTLLLLSILLKQSGK